MNQQEAGRPGLGKSRNQGGCGILGFRKQEAEELVLNKSRWERTWLLIPRLFFLPLLKSTFEWPQDPHGNCSRLRILTSQLQVTSPHSPSKRSRVGPFSCAQLVMSSGQWTLRSAMALCNGSYFQPLLTNEELPHILQTEGSVMGQRGALRDTRLCQARRCVAETEVGGHTDPAFHRTCQCMLLPLLRAKEHNGFLFLLDMEHWSSVS